MVLEPLRIEKNWFTDGNTREDNWDEIADNTVAFASRTNNNLKQVGLDINGSKYIFNNNGRATQTTPIVDRLDTLEKTTAIVGTRNIGLDLTDQDKIKIVSADGTAFSSANQGLVDFNDTNNAGQIITREVTSNIEVTLTGAHWGFTGTGDLTDFVLWVILIDTGSGVILGVAVQGGRQDILVADSETAVGNVNSFEKILTDTAVAATNNVVHMGWVFADYDDTGNAGGENFWTVQNSTGDVNIGPSPTTVAGTIYY